MNAPLRKISLAAALALPLAAQAQNELSNFTATGRGGVINTFATDYQAIGINPANLGRSTKVKVAFTVGEAGAGVSSQSMTRTTFKHLVFDTDQALTPAERTNLVNSLTSDNTVNVTADVTTVGLAVTLPAGLGGIAVNHRLRGQGHLALNRNAADIIVNGQNAAIVQQYYGSSASSPPPQLSVVLAGTNIQAAITSEYSIAYGVPVVNLPTFKLAAGVGYRYIQGIGIADIRIENGTFYGYNALSPKFKVNYGSLSASPNFNYVNGDGFEDVGHGHGFDLGLAAEVGKVLRLGVSVVDLGSMSWTGNVLTAQDQPLQNTNSNGIETYNLFNELKNQFSNDDGSLLSYETNKERKADLPTKLRTGVGYRISELFEAGFDVTVPLNKVANNMPNAFLGLGVDYKPVHWVRLSTGVSNGAGYGTSLPLGVTFVTPHWEAGISSRDVLGYFGENNPYVSAAFGLLRFKFGGEE